MCQLLRILWPVNWLITHGDVDMPLLAYGLVNLSCGVRSIFILFFFVFGWSVERLINDSGSCVFLFLLFEISGIWNKKMLFLHLLSL